VVGRLGTPVAPLANLTLKLKPARILIEQTLGLHRDAPLPAFAGHRFATWARKREAPATGTKIVFFHGCGTDYYEPEVGQKVVEVLEHNGFRVEVPKQDCCGLPLQSNGLFDDARKYVLRLARSLAAAARDGSIIVGNATSCTVMLKREAREILDLMEDPDLKVVSEHMYDICEYLVMLHDRGELALELQPLPMTVTYHAPCQQQGHGIGKPALELMALIPELTVIENDAVCCGVAGTYGIKVEKYEIAANVGRGLFDQIEDARPDLAVCDSETCRWHIEGSTGVRTVHPLEIIHRAAGLSSDAELRAPA
jgi:glycerol-3-phosphate dehydrogenase subunit C